MENNMKMKNTIKRATEQVTAEQIRETQPVVLNVLKRVQCANCHHQITGECQNQNNYRNIQYFDKVQCLSQIIDIAFSCTNFAQYPFYAIKDLPSQNTPHRVLEIPMQIMKNLPCGFNIISEGGYSTEVPITFFTSFDLMLANFPYNFKTVPVLKYYDEDLGLTFVKYSLTFNGHYGIQVFQEDCMDKIPNAYHLTEEDLAYTNRFIGEIN